MDVGCVCIPHVGAWAIRECGGRDDLGDLVVVEAGRVTAASVAAQSAGVETGMTIARVRTICPEATVRPRDPALEAAAWQRVEARLNATTPYVETDAPGRAFVRPHRRDDLARTIEDLDARAALAPSRAVARLAAGKAIRGELLQIEADYVTSFLRRLSVDALGQTVVSPDLAEQLGLFGYDTVHAVRSLSKRHLTAQFGEDGARLHAFLHDDDPPVSAYVPPPSICEAYTFEHDHEEPGRIETVLAELVEEGVQRLDRRTAQRLTVRLEERGKPTQTAARTLREPKEDAGDLAGLASTLLHTLVHDGMRVSAVSVELGALATPTGRQGRLFHERPGVRKAVEAVEQRYPGAVRRVVTEAAAIFDEDQYDFVPVRAA
jgi:nucleotidyltransferase/DNA polymerase involved in DNA repair